MYKEEHPFEKRRAEGDKIRRKYPDRVPVSTNYQKSSFFHHLTKYFFLCGLKFNMSDFCNFSTTKKIMFLLLILKS